MIPTPSGGHFELDNGDGGGDGHDDEGHERETESKKNDEDEVEQHLIVAVQLGGDDVPTNLSAFLVLGSLPGVRQRLKHPNNLRAHRNGCQDPPHSARAQERVDSERAYDTEAAFHGDHRADAARRRFEPPPDAQAGDQALGIVLRSNDLVDKGDEGAGCLDCQDDEVEHVDKSQAEQTQVHPIPKPLTPEHYAVQYVGGDTDKEEQRVHEAVGDGGDDGVRFVADHVVGVVPRQKLALTVDGREVLWIRRKERFSGERVCDVR